jgi:hypothetical protein
LIQGLPLISRFGGSSSKKATHTLAARSPKNQTGTQHGTRFTSGELPIQALDTIAIIAFTFGQMKSSKSPKQIEIAFCVVVAIYASPVRRQLN